MVEFLKAKEIKIKARNAQNDFAFNTQLQVIDCLTKRTTDGRDLPYLIVKFRDVTDEISNFRQWTNSEEEYLHLIKNFKIGKILEMNATFKKRHGSSSINNYVVLKDGEFNLDNFVKSSNIDVDLLINKLEDIISNIKNQKLKELLEKIFSDEEIKQKYIECPSARKHHQAYKFGNLEHTIGMLTIFENYVNFYNRITLLNVDLIFAGIILHDIGKIKEYTLYNGIPKQTNEGKLFGHLLLGNQLVAKYIEDIEDFPKDLENRIQHLILSHHGKKEWGAIVEPLFGEAEILHYLDMIDSRFKLNFRPDQWEP